MCEGVVCVGSGVVDPTNPENEVMVCVGRCNGL
jgi:hypothetical protein